MDQILPNMYLKRNKKGLTITKKNLVHISILILLTNFLSTQGYRPLSLAYQLDPCGINAVLRDPLLRLDYVSQAQDILILQGYKISLLVQKLRPDRANWLYRQDINFCLSKPAYSVQWEEGLSSTGPPRLVLKRTYT